MNVSSDPGLCVEVSFLGYNFMLSTKIFYIMFFHSAVSLMSSEQTSPSSRHHQYQQTARVLARDSVINMIIASVYIYIQGALGNLEACGMGVQRRIKQSYVPG